MSIMDDLNERFVRLQFGSGQRTRIYEKLIDLLHNNIKLTEALDICWVHASYDGNKPKRVAAIALDTWRTRVRDGVKLGDAMEGWIPDSDRMVIKAGEEAGKVEEALRNALRIQEGMSKIRGAIWGGVAYPMLLMAAVVGFLVIFGVMVVPAFNEVYPREKWTGAGGSLAFLSDFVDIWLMPIVIAFFACVAVSMWSMPRWTGRIRVYADKVPPFSLYRMSVGVGFMLTVSAMTKANVTFTDTLRALLRDANPWYRERLGRALQLMTNGRNLGEALYLAGHAFPDEEAVLDLRAFAGLAGFEVRMQKMGVKWIELSVQRVQGQMKIFAYVALVLMTFVIGWLGAGLQSVLAQIQSGVQ
ncbi:Toxin coregulated pilus biosynthesis protein E [Methylobacterium hispanicum]|uniref:Toxin coregulated pilus biosynthesis protein E n=1 Tax=Methylobacterium hispanicum TaxID=270350 RepID=A0AAV4ZN24_9HYPH|nr:type II secretion system F family protein [Methylobacterium hispanicum]GJD89425.1 Toxin coregulated pilus biosynthesis protein E [Methylobacterium hispanicum]